MYNHPLIDNMINFYQNNGENYGSPFVACEAPFDLEMHQLLKPDPSRSWLQLCNA